jgi:hypothetical protein
MDLISDGDLQASGVALKDAWRAAMGSECHGMPVAGIDSGVGY